MSVAELVEHGVAPLDRLRLACFRVVRHYAWARSLLLDRERRLAWLLCLHAPIAACLALYFPVHLFALGPLLLGVPHLASDVRYLLLRRELPQPLRVALWSGTAALVALSIYAGVHGPRATQRIEIVTGALLVAFAALVARREQRSWRAHLCVSFAVAFGIAGSVAPAICRSVLLHVHNLAAIALVFVAFPARRRTSVAPWVLVFALALCLATGAFYRTTLASPGPAAFGVHAFELSDWIAPTLRPDRALGLSSAFVFLQSIHYAIWLFVIPQREQRGEGTLSFGMSARSLLRDFGPLALFALVLLAIALPAAAAFGVWRAQRAYLSLANFHAYLEFAMLSFYWARGR